MDISSIVMHSGAAGPASLFVAIPGLKADGHSFLEDAYRAGARAFVTQRPYRKPGATTIVVPDCRAALAALAARMHGNPSQHLTLVGITGTNGKTTTAFLTESILQEAGMPAGLLSTIAYRLPAQTLPAERTTPDQLELQRLLRAMVDAGMRGAVMEVSSHGLDQRRVDGCDFDTGIFTNLSPEHLDYHHTMEEYYASKERFFTELLAHSSKKSATAVINRDDPLASRLISRTTCRVVTFGLADGDTHAANVRISLEGISADILTGTDRFSVTSGLTGIFNLYNILAASAAATALGIHPAAMKAGIERVRTVPGRMERIAHAQGKLIFVDYAHTGDALANVLKTLVQVGARDIITIFGCGGDRDREKRPVMGGIAADYSTSIILTSDNPRSEEPQQIIREIEQGVRAAGFTKEEHRSTPAARNRCYWVIPDRRQAIQHGIALAGTGTVVLIAGKGHETHQQIGDRKIHFDDRDEARQALRMYT